MFNVRGFTVPVCLSLLVFIVLPSRVDGTAAHHPLAEKYCTACHLAAAPDTITREHWPEHWPELFGLMATWMGERQMPIVEDEYRELLDHYLANSPATMAPIPDDLEESLLVFERGEIGVECTEDRPKITNVNITDLDGDGKKDILVCDDVAVSGGSNRSPRPFFSSTRSPG
jgi:hypothetical protein